MAKEVMKTLLRLKSPPPHTPRTPARNQRNPFLRSKSVKYPNLHPKSWRLHVEGKGFNRPARADNLPPQKERQEKISFRKNSNGNDSDDDDDKIPDVVWERMIVRILFYVGVPMATGFALLQIFSVIKEQNLWDVPIWLPFLTTFITFGASTLGIVYGTLSTSWDPEREGSLLGFEQVQKNWVDMWKEEGDSS